MSADPAHMPSDQLLLQIMPPPQSLHSHPLCWCRCGMFAPQACVHAFRCRWCPRCQPSVAPCAAGKVRRGHGNAGPLSRNQRAQPGQSSPSRAQKKSQNQTFKIESRFGQTTADRAGCEAVGGAPVQSSEARSRPRDILRPHTRVARRRACAQLRLPPIRSARGRRAQGRTSGACSSPAGGALCATASFGAAQRSSRPVRRASAHRAPL